MVAPAFDAIALLWVGSAYVGGEGALPRGQDVLRRGEAFKLNFMFAFKLTRAVVCLPLRYSKLEFNLVQVDVIFIILTLEKKTL